MKFSELLNDLIIINNHRVAFYDKAATLTADENLLHLFTNIASETRQGLIELKQVASFEVAEREMTGGKIYWDWMHSKAIANKDNRKDLLASCILAEYAVQNAYQAFLDEDGANDEIRTLIEKQKKAAADTLNKMNNMYNPETLRHFH